MLSTVLKLPPELNSKYQRVAQYALKKKKLRLVEKKSVSELRPLGREIFQLINAAYSDLYEFTPMTDGEIDALIKKFFNLIDPRFVKLVVDTEDKIVALGVAMPSWSGLMQKLQGRMRRVFLAWLGGQLKGSSRYAGSLPDRGRAETSERWVERGCYAGDAPVCRRRWFQMGGNERRTRDEFTSALALERYRARDPQAPPNLLEGACVLIILVRREGGSRKAFLIVKIDTDRVGFVTEADVLWVLNFVVPNHNIFAVDFGFSPVPLPGCRLE